VTLPDPGESTVDGLSDQPVEAGDSPISIATADPNAGEAPDSVSVNVLDQNWDCQELCVSDVI
jgi:hypothetical protein